MKKRQKLWSKKAKRGKTFFCKVCKTKLALRAIDRKNGTLQRPENVFFSGIRSLMRERSGKKKKKGREGREK